MNDEYRMLLELTDKPQHIDDLCKKLQWPVAKASGVLGLLELKGEVERVYGMRFRKVDTK